jgi:hypothetical protein
MGSAGWHKTKKHKAHKRIFYTFGIAYPIDLTAITAHYFIYERHKQERKTKEVTLRKGVRW